MEDSLSAHGIWKGLFRITVVLAKVRIQHALPLRNGKQLGVCAVLRSLFVLADIINEHQRLACVLIAAAAQHRCRRIIVPVLRTCQQPVRFPEVLVFKSGIHTRDQYNTVISIAGATVDVTLVEVVEISRPLRLKVRCLKFVGNGEDRLLRRQRLPAVDSRPWTVDFLRVYTGCRPQPCSPSSWLLRQTPPGQGIHPSVFHR